MHNLVLLFNGSHTPGHTAHSSHCRTPDSWDSPGSRTHGHTLVKLHLKLKYSSVRLWIPPKKWYMRYFSILHWYEPFQDTESFWHLGTRVLIQGTRYYLKNPKQNINLTWEKPIEAILKHDSFFIRHLSQNGYLTGSVLFKAVLKTVLLLIPQRVIYSQTEREMILSAVAASVLQLFLKLNKQGWKNSTAGKERVCNTHNRTGLDPWHPYGLLHNSRSDPWVKSGVSPEHHLVGDPKTTTATTTKTEQLFTGFVCSCPMLETGKTKMMLNKACLLSRENAEHVVRVPSFHRYTIIWNEVEAFLHLCLALFTTGSQVLRTSAKWHEQLQHQSISRQH